MQRLKYYICGNLAATPTLIDIKYYNFYILFRILHNILPRIVTANKHLILCLTLLGLANCMDMMCELLKETMIEGKEEETFGLP